jgi:2-keto-3-deoxy-L-rhamnonate aldolase RhmA
MRKLIVSAVACSLLLLMAALKAQVQSGSAPKYFNTVKQKMIEGRQITGPLFTTPDASVYCTVANSGFDYVYIDMQHSTLTYADVGSMLSACKGAQAIPFIRVPDATESEIQKATDTGALGIIVPTIDTVEKAQAAAKWTRYPPVGKRSQGSGLASVLWGNNYRESYNDNVVLVAMIENEEGAKIADQIASVPGVDVVMIGSGDLASFTGKPQGDPFYEGLVTKIHDATVKAGKKVAGPGAWRGRGQFSFFFEGNEHSLIRAGAQQLLKSTPANK